LQYLGSAKDDNAIQKEKTMMDFEPELLQIVLHKYLSQNAVWQVIKGKTQIKPKLGKFVQETEDINMIKFKLLSITRLRRIIGCLPVHNVGRTTDSPWKG
jgi:hypothetical protein